MGDTVKVSWSGGKDSTCSMIMRIARGDTVKAVCYVPMLTKEIPLIRKNHYEFILCAAEKFRNQGAQINIVSGMTYQEFVLHTVTKGERKGKIYGFPCFITGACNFKNYSKEKAIDNCYVGFYNYQDIGIAYDEVQRQKQLNHEKRSILVEEKITELGAMDICAKHGLISPHYSQNKRDGCALCPNAKPAEREAWFAEHPQAKGIVLELQDAVKREYPYDTPRRYPLRNKQWFL